MISEQVALWQPENHGEPGHTGSNWLPTYNLANNQYQSIPGFTPPPPGGYDANGNLLADSFHAYVWDAKGKAVSIDGTATGMTYEEGCPRIMKNSVRRRQ